MNENGEQCPVFTPEEGGSLIEDGYSVSAEPGAVENDTYIAVCMDPIGPVSNAGMTEHRFTLVDDAYSVTALDSQGRRFTNYHFVTHAEACLPIAEDLRTRLSDIELIAVDEDNLSRSSARRWRSKSTIFRRVARSADCQPNSR